VQTNLLDEHVEVLGDLRGKAYYITPSVKDQTEAELMCFEKRFVAISCASSGFFFLSHGVDRTAGLEDSQNLVTCMAC
jgi:hypothetical protein